MRMEYLLSSSYGVFRVTSGAHLALNNSAFKSNTPDYPNFPSVQRNVQCDNGTLSVVSLSDDSDGE